MTHGISGQEPLLRCPTCSNRMGDVRQREQLLEWYCAHCRVVYKPQPVIPDYYGRCLDCDSFGCESANGEAQRVGACSRKGCGRPPSEHDYGRFCP